MKKHSDSAAPPGGSKCPHCGSDRVVCNGSYPTKNRGRVWRFVCTACKRPYKELENPSQILSGTRIKEAEGLVLKALALLCFGLPLSQIEGLLDRKSETIHGWVQECFGKPQVWRDVIQRMAADFGVEASEVEMLSDLVSQLAQGEATFHAFSRRQLTAGLKARRRRRHLTEAELAQLDSAPHMAGLSKEEAEIEKQKLQRSLAQPVPIKPTKSQQVERGRIRERVERVLGASVVLTSEGDFYLRDDDHRIVSWLGEVERFDARKGEKLIKLLTPSEQMVFNQVRQPNQHAHTYAKLEGARGTRRGDPWPERMTPWCLAAGLGFEFGGFIDCLKSLASFLRSPG